MSGKKEKYHLKATSDGWANVGVNQGPPQSGTSADEHTSMMGEHTGVGGKGKIGFDRWSSKQSKKHKTKAAATQAYKAELVSKNSREAEALGHKQPLKRKAKYTAKGQKK